MTHVFHRRTAAASPKAVRGEGVYIFDEDGRRYLDGSGGAAVSCLGHNDPDVTAAIHAQLDAIAFAHTGFFTNDPMERLADRLAESAPDGLDWAYFVSGGSEAVESALKIARQYFLDKGEPRRHKVIARRQSYHGNTMGALSTGGHRNRRRPYEPMLIDFAHVSACNPYRGMIPGESEEAYGARLALELETTIRALDPETVMAFVAEPVVGASMGAMAAVPGYFRRVREICDHYGILLIFDEVMCGMGRTGHLFACEAEGVTPDLLTMAKGLGAGYQPIGAVMVHDRIYQAVCDGAGGVVGGHTYMGHPTACAAALAVQEAIAERGLIEQVRARGDYLDQRLRERFGGWSTVGDIRGRGLFRALELVQDRETRQPFDPSLKLHARVKARAMEQGLICYPDGGTADGVAGDHVLLAPPFIITEAQIDELVDKLEVAMTNALADVAVPRAA